MKNYIISLFILLISFSLKSQETIGIGDWRGHFPYNSLISITSDNKGTIYAASKYSLFSYNNETGLINIYSKINYLSDINIKCIKYNTEHNILIIAYSNGNLDLIKDKNVINMNDIYRSNIIGNKTINNIFFKNKYAYLSCGFGIVVLDLVKLEITDTYYIGENNTYINVNDFTYLPTNHIFAAATNEGIYFASDTSNLSYYINWHKVNDMPHSTSHFNTMVSFKGNIITNIYTQEFNNDTLLVYDGNEWKYFSEEKTNGDVQKLEAINDELVITYKYSVDVYDNLFNQTFHYWTYNDSTGMEANHAIREGTICWVADNLNGLAKCKDIWRADLITPSGPEVAQAFKIKKYDNNIYAIPGGYNISWVPLYNMAKYSVFTSNNWKTYSSKNIPGLENYKDIADIAIDPRNPERIFLASYSYGLIEIVNNKIVKVHNGHNSPLKAPTGYPEEDVRCGGITFDENNNLWVSHSVGNGILNVLLSDNTWANVDNGGLFQDISNKEVSSIIIDTYGQKWLKTRDYGTIYVLNDNNTPSNPTDDKWKRLNNTIGNGALNGQISTIAVDKEGKIWIGSDLGIKVIYYPNKIFEGGNFDAQDILVEYDGTVRPLLENESITAIAVDYGDNKWIGTANSGVYYVSSDGTKEYSHFTKVNSPLLSDNIIDITIDYMGEVFISTSNGICSFKSSSSEPRDTNDEIYAYPNPVPPDFTGKIAVTGLIENAHVKITDFAGRIVYSEISNGGMITWNGNLPNGKRASTGVYVVFVTDAKGKERAVTKILFIK